MRLCHPRLRKPAFLAAALVMAGAAPLPPSNAVQFPVGNMQFGRDDLRFGSDTLTFPTSLDRTETASMIEVVLPADVLFDFDKSDVRPDAAATLHEVAVLIREQARGPVSITGFTDALGGDAYNQRLSERRAGAVKTWLIAREGLAPARFTTAGRGARDPVAPNRHPDGSDDPDGRQRNRRVTLKMRK